MDPIRAARALVERQRHGMLSTAHAVQDGWPFGSLAPYALTPDGDPILLVATIAEHTKNLRSDPRASLLIADPKAIRDPLAGARVTLLCRADEPDDAAAIVARTAYADRFPGLEERLGAHDFVLFHLRVQKVRWVAGFGEMGWLDRAEWGAAR